MIDLKKIITDFMNEIKSKKIEVYNEFSFQHELGIFLRNRLVGKGYQVQFERNVEYFGINRSDTIKKEIDISIFKPDKPERYAIELKFPRKGQIPEQMYAFVKDIKFLEQLKGKGFNEGLSIAWVDDPLYYEGRKYEGIYKYFRGANTHVLSGKIHKPTGNSNESVTLDGTYRVTWISVFRENNQYFIIEA